ncbi:MULTISPECIES: aspartate/glutamate racemase family protein [Chryseobacterium]|uniref:aspartate/glutamate racemase family protein n=1 Tax=Chryseobacterium TaxID=59732 RepID=UPI001BE76521|nr:MULTISPECIES: amino acid racemase [Chryseobacterium]MBT2620803.1 amino acid racemase [Chryseobacterium sp. ISL-6]
MKLKKIGLVGGISWVSTLDYYTFINEGINNKLGGLNFAECIIYSLNFGDIQEKTWENSYELLLNACESLKKSGAEAIVLCANTAHLFADKLEEQIQLPFINIISETAKSINKAGLKTIGLLGTKFTMEMDFYSTKLESFGIQVLTPETQEVRDYIQHTVKEELGRGIVNHHTKEKYLEIIQDLIKRGAEGIILGCTEIPLLLNQNDFSIPVFDTTKIHSEAIIEYAISS